MNGMKNTSGDSGLDRVADFLVNRREFLQRMFSASDPEYIQALANAIGHLVARARDDVNQDELLEMLQEIIAEAYTASRKMLEEGEEL